MKKIVYILALAAAMMSCNGDINDVYRELPVEPFHMDVAYTLTATDYNTISAAALKDATTPEETALANAVKNSASLNWFASADKYVPAILAKAYLALNRNSTCQVSFAYTEDYLAALGGAPTYTLTAADYQLVWGEDSSTDFFTPSATPAAKLPAILKEEFPDAEAGDIKIVTFKIADEEPSASPIRLSEDFDGYTVATSAPYTMWNENGWTQVAVQGGTAPKYWQVRTYSGNKYGQISANGNPVEITEIYEVSPVVDLTQTTNNEFSFDIVVGYWTADCLKVLITENPACLTTPATVTWTDVSSSFTIPQAPASGYSTFVTAGTLNLDTSWAGKKIYIAFYYRGEPTGVAGNNWTTTYEIDNVLVKGIAPGGGKEVAKRNENLIYTYNGTAWVPYQNAVILNPADYTAMGVSSLTATTAPQYLPVWLSRKYPYALEGNKIAIVYKNSATTNTADEYIFSAGKWVPSTKGALKKAQFIHNGEKWVFDPTVNVTMVSADYQIMCTYVLEHPELGVYKRGTYTNEEWYYGFSAYYANVNFRLSGSQTSSRDVPCSVEYDTELHREGITPEEQIEILWNRLTLDGMHIYLAIKYPDSQVEVQGIPLYYNITLKVFYPDGVTNTTLTYVLHYKVLTSGGSGVPPTFEYVGKEQI